MRAQYDLTLPMRNLTEMFHARDKCSRFHTDWAHRVVRCVGAMPARRTRTISCANKRRRGGQRAWGRFRCLSPNKAGFSLLLTAKSCKAANRRGAPECGALV